MLPSVLLVDRLPRLGFFWPQDQGSPRVLRADHRDAAVMAALLAVAGNDGHVRRYQVLAALERSWDFLSHAFRDAQLGLLDREDMVTWLFRVRRSGGDPLAPAIRPNIWWVKSSFVCFNFRLKHSIMSKRSLSQLPSMPTRLLTGACVCFFRQGRICLPGRHRPKPVPRRGTSGHPGWQPTRGFPCSLTLVFFSPLNRANR